MAESSSRLAGLVSSLYLASVSTAASFSPDAAPAPPPPYGSPPPSSNIGAQQQRQQQGVRPLPFLPLLASRANGAGVGDRLKESPSLRVRAQKGRIAALRGGAKKPATGKPARARKGGKRGGEGGEGGESGEDDSEGEWSWDRYHGCVGCLGAKEVFLTSLRKKSCLPTDFKLNGLAPRWLSSWFMCRGPLRAA